MKKKNPHGTNQWSDVDGGYAFVIPFTTLRHPNFMRLSAHACKLLLDLGRQYSGFNNGYLSAAMTILRPMGWKSEATVREAVAECTHYGMVLKTRQGGRNRCNLYAFTWWRIHSKDRRPLDVMPTMQPSNEWKTDRSRYAKPCRKKKKLPPPRLPSTTAADRQPQPAAGPVVSTKHCGRSGCCREHRRHGDTSSAGVLQIVLPYPSLVMGLASGP